MSNLQKQLASLKKRFMDNVPPTIMNRIQDAEKEMSNHGFEDRVLGVNADAPTFQLENQDGHVVDSTELLSKGPLILTFYRGFW